VSRGLLTRADLPPDAITVSNNGLKNWYDCRYKWRLIYVENIGRSNFVSEKANLGDIFHKFQQWYYNQYIGTAVGPVDEIGQMQALQFVQDHCENTAEAGANLFKIFMIWNLYTEWAAKQETLVPTATEVETFADTGIVSRDGRPIYLHVIIDLLGDNEDKLAIVDHKSHTNRHWTKERILHDPQLIFYWIALELQGYHVDVAIINSVNVAVPKDDQKFRASLRGPERFARFERLYLTEKDVKLQFYFDEISKNIKEMWVVSHPEYPMRLTDNCAFCAYREHIPMDAAGNSAGAMVHLRSRFNTEVTDLEVFDDTEDIVDSGT